MENIQSQIFTQKPKRSLSFKVSIWFCHNRNIGWMIALDVVQSIPDTADTSRWFFLPSRFSLNKKRIKHNERCNEDHQLFSRGCRSALMNYTAANHPRHFGWGDGGRGRRSRLLICSVCGGKHCMIYQSLEMAYMTAAGSPLSRAAANAGWRALRLREWGHICEPGSQSEVTSG